MMPPVVPTNLRRRFRHGGYYGGERLNGERLLMACLSLEMPKRAAWPDARCLVKGEDKVLAADACVDSC